MSELGMAIDMITGIFEKRAGFHQGDESPGGVGAAVLLVLRSNSKILPVLFFARDEKVRIYAKEYPQGTNVNGAKWSCIGENTSPSWWVILDQFLSSRSPSIYFQTSPYGSYGWDYSLVEEVIPGFFIIRLKPVHIKALAQLQ